MKWFRKIFQNMRYDLEEALRVIHDKFTSFLTILDKNNQVLKVTGDMEEKSQGEYLFDINYIRTSLSEIRSGVEEIIENGQKSLAKAARCNAKNLQYVSLSQFREVRIRGGGSDTLQVSRKFFKLTSF